MLGNPVQKTRMSLRVDSPAEETNGFRRGTTRQPNQGPLCHDAESINTSWASISKDAFGGCRRTHSIGALFV
jgi:hypothetical protein